MIMIGRKMTKMSMLMMVSLAITMVITIILCVFELTMMKADLLMEVWLANMRPDTLWEEET